MSVIHGPNYGTPTLDLNFAGNKSLIDTVSGQNLVTFSRSQTGKEATYVGADGLIKYAGADEPRFDHNPVTGECLGLLIEEQRTNNVTYSATQADYSLQGTGTAAPSSTTAPDSTTNTCIRVQGLVLNDGISKATLISTTGNHFPTVYARSRIGASQNVKVTQSGAIGPTITLPADGSWIRVTGQVANLGSGNRDIRILQATANPIDIDVWGFQTELGAFPTSYILTAGSTKTRSADQASITGTNFSRWYNQSEGTWFGSIPNPGKTSSTRIINTSVNLWSGPTNAGYVRTGSSSVLLTTTYPVKVAAKYDDSSLSGAVNGTLMASTGGTNSIATYIDIGSANTVASGVGFINNPISRITYYPTRLQNYQLQQLTK